MKYQISITLDLKTDDTRKAVEIAKEIMGNAQMSYESLEVTKEENHE